MRGVCERACARMQSTVETTKQFVSITSLGENEKLFNQSN